MKDRVREAVFNLIGPRVVGKQVVDLFAGTGALSFEALSRGAASALILERKFPTARRIEETAAEFGLKDRVEVSAGDSFVWAQRLQPTNDNPWLVFCSPPYEFFVARRSELHRLLQHLWSVALPTSLFILESDGRLDVAAWFPTAHWTVRSYPPAIIGISEKN
jgi:16S rRNA (guanine966-N2)-methyltransferase